MGKREENAERSIERLRKMLATMEYGTITLVVQDKYVVQIERTEKVRLK